MSVMSDAIKLCLYPCKSTRKKQDFITSYFIVSLCIGMAIALALALALSVLALLTSLHFHIKMLIYKTNAVCGKLPDIRMLLRLHKIAYYLLFIFQVGTKLSCVAMMALVEKSLLVAIPKGNMQGKMIDQLNWNARFYGVRLPTIPT